MNENESVVYCIILHSPSYQYIELLLDFCRTQQKLLVAVHDVCMYVLYVQLKVRPQDLQLCLETSSGVDASGQYQLGDMVQLE